VSWIKVSAEVLPIITRRVGAAIFKMEETMEGTGTQYRDQLDIEVGVLRRALDWR
jgi:hypothetical protein